MGKGMAHVLIHLPVVHHEQVVLRTQQELVESVHRQQTLRAKEGGGEGDNGPKIIEELTLQLLEVIFFYALYICMTGTGFFFYGLPAMQPLSLLI